MFLEMALMPKDVYKTIKRSIAATTNGFVGNGLGFGTINSTRLSNGFQSKHWIHPPDILVNGRVIYTARMWGKIEVAKAKGSEVASDAIRAIQFRNDLNDSVTGHTGPKMRKINLHININGLSIIDHKTHAIIHKIPLRRISFCADDHRDKHTFSFIAKNEESKKFECFVFTSEKMAEKITLTIGEAFDLAYERYCREDLNDLEKQRELIVLKKRIAELETENKKLQSLLSSSNVSSDKETESKQIASIPIIPNTPIPPVPSVSNNLTLNGVNSLQNQQKLNNPIAIAPPPFHNSRRQLQNSTLNQNETTSLPNDSIFSLNELFIREKQGPDVGTRLQNLQIDRLEDVFDDEFDPRADEKKTEKKQLFNTDQTDKITNESVKTSSDIVEDFEAILRQIDERMAEVKEGFTNKSLERGDTGISENDQQKNSNQN